MGAGSSEWWWCYECRPACTHSLVIIYWGDGEMEMDKWIPPSIYNNNNNNNSAAFKCDYSRFVSTCMPPVLWLGWAGCVPYESYSLIQQTTRKKERKKLGSSSSSSVSALPIILWWISLLCPQHTLPPCDHIWGGNSRLYWHFPPSQVIQQTRRIRRRTMTPAE